MKSVTSKSRWPSQPPIENLDSLPDYLTEVGASPEARDFCTALARDGIAIVDLGDEGRELCDRAVLETEARFAGGQIKRIQDAWIRSKSVRKLAIFKKIKKLLEIAYGRPAFAFQTLNFQVGTEQAIHSDTIHFHSMPERFMCGVWTALEDISETAGPLTYFPGSHTLPVLTMRKAGVNNPDPTYDDYVNIYLPRLQQQLEASNLTPKTITIRKGQAAVWAANLAHGGSRIVDISKTRKSLVTHFYFKDCVYYTPMQSEPEENRLFVRLPVDIEAGWFRLSKSDGRYVWPHPSQLKSTARKLIMRDTAAS